MIKFFSSLTQASGLIPKQASDIVKIIVICSSESSYQRAIKDYSRYLQHDKVVSVMKFDDTSLALAALAISLTSRRQMADLTYFMDDLYLEDEDFMIVLPGLAIDMLFRYGIILDNACSESLEKEICLNPYDFCAYLEGYGLYINPKRLKLDALFDEFSLYEILAVSALQSGKMFELTSRRDIILDCLIMRGGHHV